MDAVLAYASDEEWGRYLPVPAPYTARDAELFIAQQLLADHDVRPHWALEHEGVVSGAVEVGLDHEQGVAEVHYALARPLWGLGLMTEAVRSVLSRVLVDLPHIARVESRADVRNVASLRVMEKCGLVHEGVRRSCHVIRGERVDEAYHALLRADWSSPPSS